MAPTNEEMEEFTEVCERFIAAVNCRSRTFSPSMRQSISAALDRVHANDTIGKTHPTIHISQMEYLREFHDLNNVKFCGCPIFPDMRLQDEKVEIWRRIDEPKE